MYCISISACMLWKAHVRHSEEQPVYRVLDQTVSPDGHQILLQTASSNCVAQTGVRTCGLSSYSSLGVFFYKSDLFSCIIFYLYLCLLELTVDLVDCSVFLFLVSINKLWTMMRSWVGWTCFVQKILFGNNMFPEHKHIEEINLTVGKLALFQ